MSNKDMFRIDIMPAYFVPNIADRMKNNRRVHVVRYGKCNYRCDFCFFGRLEVPEYNEYTLESFEQELWGLMRYSKNFKFTGGEPTLNPYLMDIMKLTKVYAATNFLDTNGSNPKKVRELLEAGVVDIVGISLKGLSPDEAARTASITNKKLCWDNVWETIRIVSEYPDVSLIITYVACEGYFKESDLDTLSELLEPYPNVTLKINNCYLEDMIDYRRTGLDKSEIYSMVRNFVERKPEYKGRTVLFRDHESCLDEEKIDLF